MQKTYMLDTNILIHSSDSLSMFADNHILIPMTVIEELDKLKKAEGDKGYNARNAIRQLGEYREKGNLVEGVSTPSGGSIRIVPSGEEIKKNDDHILKSCVENHAILVTKDNILRIKAQMEGIETQDYRTDQTQKDTFHSFDREYFAEDIAFRTFRRSGIPLSAVYRCNEEGEREPAELVMNQFVILKSDQNMKKTVLGRFDGTKVVALKYEKESPFGVKPRNAGQYFLQEALMDDSIPLVIVSGIAGTAKTFYSLAVGLEKTYNRNQYRKILVSRPNAQFDSDIGFLPGSEQEKISPLLRPVIDNLEQLVDGDETERYKDEAELGGKIRELFDRGVVTAEAMNFIRGRSFVNTFLIIDEAQNMTPRQIKGVITRAGKGTKIVILGDPEQIDSPYLDRRTNGVSYAMERMQGSSLCCQITMRPDECERSELAMEAARRME